ncbi:MAG: leucine-rich repeat protein [Lachnospiraceae bacterium]|nr:leucine-rich repeat protein [Lachnospiraceae bacterium]
MAKVTKKTAKKRRRHLKKNARWTIAGLLMATAIIIALIPVQNGGVSAFNNKEGAKEVKVDTYDLDTLLSSTSSPKHATTYSKKYGDSDSAYKVYLVAGTIPANTYSTDKVDTDLPASCVDDENLGKLSITRTRSQQSNNGGETFETGNITAALASKDLFLLCDVNGNPISQRASAVAPYTVDSSDPTVITRYLGGGTIALNQYDKDAQGIGLAYASDASLITDVADSTPLSVGVNNKDRFYAVRTIKATKDTSYEVVYDDVPVLDGEGNPVMEEDGLTPKTEKKLNVAATDANRSYKITELKSTLDALTDNDYDIENTAYVLYETFAPETIANEAFRDKTVPHLDLSNSKIKTIGDGAFSNVDCNNSDIVLPASIEKVGTAAFYACNATSLYMNPDNNVSFGCGVFANCSSIQNNVTLNKLKSIENASTDHVKEDKTSATENKYLSCGTFANCNSIKSIEFPDYSGKLPRGTFGNIAGLDYVEVGKEGINTTASFYERSGLDENEFGQVNNEKFYIWGKFNENGITSDAHKYAFKYNIPYRYDLDTEEVERYSFLNDDGYIYDIAVPKGTLDASITSIKPDNTGTSSSTKKTLNIPYEIGPYRIVGIDNQAAYNKLDSATDTINIPASLSYIGEEAFRDNEKVKYVNFTLFKGLDSEGKNTYFDDPEDATTQIGKYCFNGCEALEEVNFKTFDNKQNRNRCCKMGDFGVGAFYTGGPKLKFISKIPEAGTEHLYGQYKYCINTEPVNVTEELTMVACTFNPDGEGILYETQAPEFISFKYLPHIDNGSGAVTLIEYPTLKTDAKLSDAKYEHKFDDIGTVEDAYKKYVEANEKGETEKINGMIYDIGSCFETIEIPAGVTCIDGTKNNVVNTYYSSANKGSYFRDLDGTKKIILRGVNHLPEGAFATNDTKSKASESLGSTLEKVEFWSDVYDLGVTDKYTPFYDSLKINQVSFKGENSVDDGHNNKNNVSYAYDNGIIYGYGCDKDGGYTEIVEVLDIRGSLDTGDPEAIREGALVVDVSNDKTYFKDVTRVGKKAFENNQNISDVDFTGTKIVELKDDAFNLCQRLKKVTLPEGFKRASNGSFSNTNQVDVYCYNTQAVFPPEAFAGNLGKPTIVHGYDEPDGLKEAITFIENTDKTAIFLPLDQFYTVRFMVNDPENKDKIYIFNWKGVQPIQKGKDAENPADNMKYLNSDLEDFGIDTSKWQFQGWNGKFTDVRSDVDVIAIMGPKIPVGSCAVTYTYADPSGADKTRHNLGELDPRFSLQTVIKGEKCPNYPSDADSRALLNNLYPGYAFNGWLLMGQNADPAKESAKVEYDLNFTADWVKSSGPYQIVFKYSDPTGADKTEHDLGEKNKDYSPQTVNHGEKGKLPDDILCKAYLDIYEGWTFKGWSPVNDLKELDYVTRSLTFTAIYEKIQTGPKATFMDHDGKVLHTEYVAPNTAPKGPTMNPSRDGYTFAGWMPNIQTPITADATYIAQYTANPAPSPSTTSTPSSSSDKTSTSNKSSSSSSSSTNKSTSSSASSSATTPRPVVVSGAPSPVGMSQVGASPSPVTGATTGSATNNGTNGNTGSNATTGNTNVVSTAPGFNNNKMSATVNGSSDNYIIKLTETTESDQCAEQALLGAFGSLDNIRYMPFDISLYDSTGTQKIDPVPEGVSVSVTMPIPDDLAVYGGNNKIGSTKGGALETIQPRFTVIDGVPCMNFTVTHFSPYVVYVDTANLTAGTLDATPKTADPIHPKWFLCIGLAALSILLFLKRDKDSLRAA